MYDAIDDPYTYSNSTVLVNKLDLRDQSKLDEFEAEISSARADEPLPEGILDFNHYKAIHHHLFRMCLSGPVRCERCVFQKVATRFAFRKTSSIKQPNFLMNMRGQLSAGSGTTSLRRKGGAFSLRVECHTRLPGGEWPNKFFILLADYAGHPLDLLRLDPDEMLTAMIDGFDGDERALAKVVKSLIS